ncbi:hypothetical protein [Cellulophaga lytica]|uniref:Uncharacterized protein n=1 Tax=Cellulophaga lytica (strain ATCC 23178 / DSM 7489 / JCM 8516 / NBRC 14961 / NCIMB 1423 / VKM B-1433 / Cy l20) TaxID=867900 RepID=F0RDK9_CELLC|nr:hypothetical protein [Cellulophaga lytica]ADY28757.1 hypothetical protein Celly_0926 [Cellulophaga lytica DSM 7489]AIM59799.1 hypothetical protein IX49_04410 [Cellulophaga lytica]WQG77063.1 hypothetical protein SR888_15385 [Cellulophaga lytica]
MKKQYKIWQNEWRQIMEKPINVEVDPKCDFDLHFDIWELDKNKFIELFNSFPKGTEIGNNAYNLRNGLIEEFNQKLNKEEIISETQKAINDLQKIAYSEELNNPKIIFRTGNSMSDLTDINYSEMISIEIDDQIYDFIKKGTGEIGNNAYHFLSEPMYRMRSSYVPSRWILWTLTDINHINPYKSLLKLENNNCSVFLIDDGGILIFQTKE